MADKTEIRTELPTDELAVIDGYCSATGKNRTDIIRMLVKEWSRAKHHEAILICRVAGNNPMAPETGR